MAREWEWYTLAGASPPTPEPSRETELLTGPGTVQRIIGNISAWSDEGGTADLFSFAWNITVGTASIDPLQTGLDDEAVMVHQWFLAPNMSTANASAPVVAQAVDSEGQRILADDTVGLWLRLDGSTPANWRWAWNVRVLLLLPE